MAELNDVFEALYDRLDARTETGGELTYVKKIFKGWRDNITKEDCDCIILEPVDIKELVPFYEEESELHFTVSIYGLKYIMDKDSQITGTTSKVGILDMDRDIKKALGGDLTLGGTCMLFTFPTTKFDFVDYPLRGVEITMEIRTRCKYKTRI